MNAVFIIFSTSSLTYSLYICYFQLFCFFTRACSFSRVLNVFHPFSFTLHVHRVETFIATVLDLIEQSTLLPRFFLLRVSH